MLLIECPYCEQKRDEAEFTYAGQAHKPRPENPESLSDDDWTEFLFRNDDAKGPYFERWNHAAGCRKFFNCARDTVTSEIFATYKAGTPAPEIGRDKPKY